MSVHMLAAFWVVSALFVITPGADWAYAITAGMHRRAIAPAVGGLLSGHLLATIIVAAGVGSRVADAPTALTVLTIGGAAYLLWLGVGMLANPPTPALAEAASRMPWPRWVARGFGVSGLNPKVFLLFLALLPQFVEPKALWSPPAQMIVLGLIHVATCGVVYTVVAFASQALLSARPAAARIVGRVSGVAMLVIALLLLADRF